MAAPRYVAILTMKSDLQADLKRFVSHPLEIIDVDSKNDIVIPPTPKRPRTLPPVPSLESSCYTKQTAPCPAMVNYLDLAKDMGVEYLAAYEILKKHNKDYNASIEHILTRPTNRAETILVCQICYTAECREFYICTRCQFYHCADCHRKMSTSTCPKCQHDDATKQFLYE